MNLLKETRANKKAFYCHIRTNIAKYQPNI